MRIRFRDADDGSLRVVDAKDFGLNEIEISNNEYEVCLCIYLSDIEVYYTTTYHLIDIEEATKKLLETGYLDLADCKFEYKSFDDEDDEDDDYNNEYLDEDDE